MMTIKVYFWNIQECQVTRNLADILEIMCILSVVLVSSYPKGFGLKTVYSPNSDKAVDVTKLASY